MTNSFMNIHEWSFQIFKYKTTQKSKQYAFHKHKITNLILNSL